MLTIAMCKPIPPVQKKKSRVKKSEVKQAISHAKNLCAGFEDTVECRIAWEKVEELSAAMADQRREFQSELSTREYDL